MKKIYTRYNYEFNKDEVVIKLGVKYHEDGTMQIFSGSPHLLLDFSEFNRENVIELGNKLIEIASFYEKPIQETKE